MKWMLTVAVILSGAFAHSEVKGKPFLYKEGKTVLEGYLAMDTASPNKRPGVLVVHDWMGISDFTRERAMTLAKMGYVVLAADIYGKGVRPKDANEAKKLSTKYKNDRLLLRLRANAALAELWKIPQTDAQRVAAIGYCFGGTTVLELARAGAPIAGVVSFHGGLDTPKPKETTDVKAKVLVLHGADDPYVPASQVADFQKEMDSGRADWQMVVYSSAVHAFAVPSAGSDKSTGAAYNANADRRSWQAMKTFFAEIFR